MRHASQSAACPCIFSEHLVSLAEKNMDDSFLAFLARTDAEDPQVPVSEAALLTAAEVFACGLTEDAEVFACGLTEDAARTAALAVALRLRPKERIAAYRAALGAEVTDAALRLPVGLAEAAYAAERIDTIMRCSESLFLTLTKREQLLTVCGYIACTKILTAPWRNTARPALGLVSSATPFLWHITSIAELAQKSGCEKAEDLLWLLRLVAAPED